MGEETHSGDAHKRTRTHPSDPLCASGPGSRGESCDWAPRPRRSPYRFRPPAVCSPSSSCAAIPLAQGALSTHERQPSLSLTSQERRLSLLHAPSAPHSLPWHPLHSWAHPSPCARNPATVWHSQPPAESLLLPRPACTCAHSRSPRERPLEDLTVRSLVWGFTNPEKP
jgi:hypothetical protein